MFLITNFKQLAKEIYGNKVIRKLAILMRPLANNLAIRRREGELGFNSEKESIIVVTHEASKTGSPILALNICHELRPNYNIITLVLRSGQLDNEFKRVSSAVLNLPYRE